MILDQGRWQGRPLVDSGWMLRSTGRAELGEWIVIAPRHQLVAVSTGDNDDNRATAAVDFFFSHVVPSVRD